MMLIQRAYRSLREQTEIRTYARAVAKAMQTYANPIVYGDYACFAYPHFLLHGLENKNTGEVVKQLEETGRIIHETLDCPARFMGKHGGPTYLEQGTKMMM